MARIFLYAIATLVGLVVIGAILIQVFWEDLQMVALREMTLDVPYDDLPVPPAPDYADAASWAARPGTPNGAEMRPEGVAKLEKLPVDVFFIHPTTYLEKEYWNAPIDAPAAQAVMARVLKAQASPFAYTGRVFAPRYRQAAFGAFLAANGDTMRALDLAYEDVRAAFRHYLLFENDGRPFILAGHSQGTVHGLRLLAEEIAGSPAAQRMIAAYMPGWPVSVREDIGALAGVDMCATPDETGCVVVWQTFAEGGDPSYLAQSYAAQAGLSGQPKAGTDMLCINPVTWRRDDPASVRAAHAGAVPPAPEVDAPIPPVQPRLVAAECGDDGFLYISPPPGGDFTQFLMPGGNYHVYDIHLFYMDVRANTRARAEAFLDARDSR